ncbi:hypothetical protein SKAU_G00364750 [Synaphobranchus kaupii]|uniref:Uncharacterized protein n=1 Tax=Synaphobranchus kaupii TaxID=118154 RepID=A0A9Q1EEV9_SYNKA|nr:hypothetical protein SKAU_G00364750 [Synaphobranchus kaupii]
MERPVLRCLASAVLEAEDAAAGKSRRDQFEGIRYASEDDIENEAAVQDGGAADVCSRFVAWPDDDQLQCDLRQVLGSSLNGF